MKTIILLIGVFCLVVGLSVFLVNPRRFINQAFAVLSGLVAAWHGSIAAAIDAGEMYALDGVSSPVGWLRLNGVLSWFIVCSISFLNGPEASGKKPWLLVLREHWQVNAAGFVLCSICLFTNLYVPADSAPSVQRRGIGYLVMVLAILVVTGFLVRRTIRRLREQRGIRRVETQFLGLNLAVGLLLVILMTSIGIALDLSWLRRSSVFVFLTSYLLAAWAITFHRVFDARQIILSLGQRVALVLAAALGVAGTSDIVAEFLPAPMNFLFSAAVWLSIALWVDQRSRKWLRLGQEHRLAELRHQTITLARTEANPAGLIAAFEHLLRSEFGASSAALLFEGEDPRPHGGFALPNDHPAYTALCVTGWETPESLERRAPSAAGDALRELCRGHDLGLVLAAPRGSPAPTLLVALGVKEGRWPFTYPEIQCVQNVAELMDNILTRSRLTAQAVERVKMEHLAMMSRGLAHDLKNLITPISSYLVHTRPRCEPGSTEEEVHAAAQRSISIMTDYVREAAFFATRLRPRLETFPLERVFAAAHELALPRAARRGIALEKKVAALAIEADAVLVQRLLLNLLNNAIDASQAGDCIVLRGSPGRTGFARLEVIDEGAGIAPENLARIFDPYFTTKEFGDDIRGFGLGLTICQKIAALHGGTISAQSAVGAGTTVTVELPLEQPRPLVDPATPAHTIS